jgi:hypothetical protein
MGVTPQYNLRYPENSDVADVPTDIQELAVDVEAQLALRATTAEVDARIDAKVMVGTAGARPPTAAEGTVYLVVP